MHSPMLSLTFLKPRHPAPQGKHGQCIWKGHLIKHFDTNETPLLKLLRRHILEKGFMRLLQRFSLAVLSMCSHRHRHLLFQWDCQLCMGTHSPTNQGQPSDRMGRVFWKNNFLRRKCFLHYLLRKMLLWDSFQTLSHSYFFPLIFSYFHLLNKVFPAV